MSDIASLTGEARTDAETNKASESESQFVIVAGETPSTDNRGTVAVARKRSSGVLHAVMLPKRGRAQALGLAYVTDLGFVHVDASDADLKAVGLQRIPAPKPESKPKSASK